VTWYVDTALVAGAWGLVTGAFVPQLIARVPEPVPEPLPDTPGEPGASPLREAAPDEADFARPIDEPKELYRDVAALPGLRWKTAAVGALAGAAIGGRLGWDWALLFLLFLVPVCVALSVIDWRTRLLPTYLVARSYAVVAVLVVAASALSSDWDALLRAGIGWLSTFAAFFVLWFIAPRGLGYGDVRLSGVLGMALGWLGVPQLLLGMYTGFLLGGVGGLLLSAVKLFHRRHYPFGPFMVAGAFLGVAFPGQLATAYGWVIEGLTSLVIAVVDAF
jgi:leader peptidase (prepilin peptidase) / N-methyltransferase